MLKLAWDEPGPIRFPRLQKLEKKTFRLLQTLGCAFRLAWLNAGGSVHSTCTQGFVRSLVLEALAHFTIPMYMSSCCEVPFERATFWLFSYDLSGGSAEAGPRFEHLFVVSPKIKGRSVRNCGCRSKRFYFCRRGMPVPSKSGMGVERLFSVTGRNKLLLNVILRFGYAPVQSLQEIPQSISRSSKPTGKLEPTLPNLSLNFY